MKSYLPHLAILMMIAVACVIIPLDKDVTIREQASVTLDLPQRVGEWRGEILMFCHNVQCQKEFARSALGESLVCPSCGGALSEMSLIERRLLPADTKLSKARYTRATNEFIFLSVVLSGAYRSSIHRPEVCLVGQGSEVAHSSRLAVEVGAGTPLELTVLDMMNRGVTKDGRPYAYASYYAYWFAAPGRETASHYVRMAWMAADRLFRDVSYPWAYIAIAGWRDQETAVHRDEIARFVAQLYPSIQVKP